MLPLVGFEPRAYDFTTLCAIVWANTLFAGSFKTFRSIYNHALLLNIHSTVVNIHCLRKHYIIALKNIKNFIKVAPIKDWMGNYFVVMSLSWLWIIF